MAGAIPGMLTGTGIPLMFAVTFCLCSSASQNILIRVRLAGVDKCLEKSKPIRLKLAGVHKGQISKRFMKVVSISQLKEGYYGIIGAEHHTVRQNIYHYNDNTVWNEVFHRLNLGFVLYPL